MHERENVRLRIYDNDKDVTVRMRWGKILEREKEASLL